MYIANNFQWTNSKSTSYLETPQRKYTTLTWINCRDSFTGSFNTSTFLAFIRQERKKNIITKIAIFFSKANMLTLHGTFVQIVVEIKQCISRCQILNKALLRKEMRIKFQITSGPFHGHHIKETNFHGTLPVTNEHIKRYVIANQVNQYNQIIKNVA